MNFPRNIWMTGLGLILMVWPWAATAGDLPVQKEPAKQLQQRIDFGNAYIMGQSIKSGAVYLMHRKKSEIESMIDVRLNYRNEIMEDHDLEDTKMVEEMPVQDTAGKKDRAH